MANVFGYLIRNVFALLCLAFMATAAQAHQTQFNIPPQALDSALLVFSEQANVQVSVSNATVSGLKTQGVTGALTPESALASLLADTGLSFKAIGSRTYSVSKSKVEQKASTGVSDIRLTLATGEDAAATSAQPADRVAAPTEIQEIIVTAQKREERLQEVPVSVTAVDAQSLADNNKLRLEDYYTKIPGLNLTNIGDVGASLVSIRGLTPGGYVNPTVGTVVDDVPFGGSVAFVSAAWTLTPDLDPSELTRVEVLRGPQGTLYGASSLGGLIKYVTAQPTMDRVSGRLQLGTNSVAKSDDIGYSVRGSVNVPLGDTFAVRASGSTREDPGYIDNVQTGRKDINNTDAKTGRLAALWRPNDDFSLKLNAMYQHTDRDGTADTHLPPPVGTVVGLGDLQQNALIDTGWFEQQFETYSATMNANIGRAQLTSLTGYSKGSLVSQYDVTPFAAFTAAAQSNFGVTGSTNRGDSTLDRFTQELRLTMPLSERIEWLVGAFYTREKYLYLTDYNVLNATTGAVAGSLGHIDQSGSYKEYALFTDLTFKITDRFDVQIGGRKSENKETFTSRTTQALFPITNRFVAPASWDDDAFTYLLTPRFKVSEDLMAYARLASGYRPGGPNSFATGTIVGVPDRYGHDSTESYELGLKGKLFQRALSFDASVYHIDWKDMQLPLRDIALLQNYTLNVGGARSRGAELTLEARPLTGLTLAVSGSYNDAELTEVPVNVQLTARPGDRLPYGARFTGNLSAEQEFALTDAVRGFAGASLSYIGDRKGRFFLGFAQGTFPSYTQLDLHAGVGINAWTVNAYVNNATDERGVLRAGRDAIASLQYVTTYIQPRVIGLSLTKDF